MSTSEIYSCLRRSLAGFCALKPLVDSSNNMRIAFRFRHSLGKLKGALPSRGFVRKKQVFYGARPISPEFKMMCQNWNNLARCVRELLLQLLTKAQMKIRPPCRRLAAV